MPECGSKVPTPPNQPMKRWGEPRDGGLIRQGNYRKVASVVAEYTDGSVAPVLQMVPGKLSSEWALGGEYDLNEVYTRSTDKHGHSERTRIGFAPHLWGEICTLVFSASTPYKTPHDLVRDAVYHRLHYWREQKPNQDWKQFDVEEALAGIERRRARIIGLNALVESSKELLEAAYKDQAWGILAENIEEVETLVVSTGDQPYHNQLIELAEKYRKHYETRTR